MMFCKKCGNMLIPIGKKLVCRVCRTEAESFVLSEKKEKEKERVIMVKEKEELQPKTRDVECPKCKHNEAYYWFVQTRAADEAPTKFLKCTKCSHTWRDYS